VQREEPGILALRILRGRAARRYAFRMVPVTASVHRLSVEDVFKMVESGVLEENDRVELVEGVLVDMVPIGAEHEDVVQWLINHLARVTGRSWNVRVQSMLLVAGGYLLPDILVIDDLPRGTLPTTAHLVIEVAYSSHARDHEKARDYAGAGVQEYWIVDLLARAVIVHRGPLAGAYQEITTFADGSSIKPLLADAPDVDVTELLG
jgi:Uma2 family endonuclease